MRSQTTLNPGAINFRGCNLPSALKVLRGNTRINKLQVNIFIPGRTADFMELKVIVYPRDIKFLLWTSPPPPLSSLELSSSMWSLCGGVVCCEIIMQLESVWSCYLVWDHYPGGVCVLSAVWLCKWSFWRGVVFCEIMMHVESAWRSLSGVGSVSVWSLCG